MSKFASEVTKLNKWDARKQLQRKAIRLIGCKHMNKEARGRRASNGVWHWTTQCMDCGLVNGDDTIGSLVWVKKSHPLILRAAGYTEIDDTLRKKTKKYIYFVTGFLFKDMLRKDREYIAAEWRDYNRFLKSEEWQADRKKVFDRDNGLCQLRHYRCTKKAAAVHHKDYTQWRRRSLSDLVACCHKCHEWEHPHMRGEDWL